MTPPFDFSTISEAVDAASDGDTIQIRSGNGYTETNVVSKKLTITGVGVTRPVVNAVGGSTNPVFDLQNRDITINFLEIDGTGTSSKAGIRSDAQSTEIDNVLISNCKIHGFTSNGFGIYLTRSNPQTQYPSGHVIEDCEIYNANVGIYIESDPDNPQVTTNHIVRRCVIHNIIENTGNYGHGIYNYGDKNVFQDTEIYQCQDKGLFLIDSYKCKILDLNHAGYPFYTHNNDVGMYLYRCSDTDIEGYSESRQLLVSDNSNYGIFLEDSDNNDLQYLEVGDNDGYGMYLDDSDDNTLRYSDITDNCFSVQNPTNYIYFWTSNGNIIEHNTVSSSAHSSAIHIIAYSNSNYINDNYLDGDITIRGDCNTVVDMDIETLYINNGENNTVSNCDISVNGDSNTNLVELYKAHNTTVSRCELDGVDDECTGIYILDSKDVDISGYEAGQALSEIQCCYTTLYVYSFTISSTVYFHHYHIYDTNGEDCADIELHRTSPYSSDVRHNTIMNSTSIEFDIDNGCSWHT